MNLTWKHIKGKMKEFRQIVIAGIKTSYSVSTDGIVTNTKTGKVLKQATHSGYKNVGILGKTQRVHRLVAQAFLSNPENKPWINHIDGCRSNNNLVNLEWCTPRENWLHAKDVLGVATFGSAASVALTSTTTLRRWSTKPNVGISHWNIGLNKYRVTLTVGTGQKTIGYAQTFEDAKELYFNAHVNFFSCYPSGPYGESLMKNAGRNTKMGAA